MLSVCANHMKMSNQKQNQHETEHRYTSTGSQQRLKATNYIQPITHQKEIDRFILYNPQRNSTSRYPQVKLSTLCVTSLI